MVLLMLLMTDSLQDISKIYNENENEFLAPAKIHNR